MLPERGVRTGGMGKWMLYASLGDRTAACILSLKSGRIVTMATCSIEYTLGKGNHNKSGTNLSGGKEGTGSEGDHQGESNHAASRCLVGFLNMHAS